MIQNLKKKTVNQNSKYRFWPTTSIYLMRYYMLIAENSYATQKSKKKKHQCRFNTFKHSMLRI